MIEQRHPRLERDGHRRAVDLGQDIVGKIGQRIEILHALDKIGHERAYPRVVEQPRPFARASLPTVKQLRPALRDLAAAAPDLTTTFKSLNRLLNMLAYNPPGDKDEGYLFWLSWANHLAPTVFATQDAHGPIRHGLVIFGCQTGALLDSVAEANPQLGTLVDLLNGPNRSGLCPTSSQEPGPTGG